MTYEDPSEGPWGFEITCAARFAVFERKQQKWATGQMAREDLSQEQRKQYEWIESDARRAIALAEADLEHHRCLHFRWLEGREKVGRGGGKISVVVEAL